MAGGLAALLVAPHVTAGAGISMEQRVTITSEGHSEQLVEMRVKEVRRGQWREAQPDLHAVILEEVGGGRHLPIWVGASEGTPITLYLQGVVSPRPMPHAFAAGLLHATGWRVREVQVMDVIADVFYAIAVVEGPTGTTPVDARPSDAIALALLVNAPIRVAARVMAATVSPEIEEWKERLSANPADVRNGRR